MSHQHTGICRCSLCTSTVMSPGAPVAHLPVIRTDGRVDRQLTWAMTWSVLTGMLILTHDLVRIYAGNTAVIASATRWIVDQYNAWFRSPPVPDYTNRRRWCHGSYPGAERRLAAQIGRARLRHTLIPTGIRIQGEDLVDLLDDLFREGDRRESLHATRIASLQARLQRLERAQGTGNTPLRSAPANQGSPRPPPYTRTPSRRDQVLRPSPSC